MQPNKSRRFPLKGSICAAARGRSLMVKIPILLVTRGLPRSRKRNDPQAWPAAAGKDLKGLISLNLVATIADDQWITRSGAACLGMKAAIDTDQAALRSLRIDSAVLFPGHRTGDAAART